MDQNVGNCSNVATRNVPRMKSVSLLCEKDDCFLNSHNRYMYVIEKVSKLSNNGFSRTHMDSNHFLRDFSDDIGLFHLINF